MSFVDGKPQIATENDVHANWSGGKDGKHFRCYFCGYRFVVGDYWRFVYTNDMSKAGGNPLVCKNCDGDDIREKWQKMCEEVRTKYWWFNRNRE